jgi:hypothetical protein
MNLHSRHKRTLAPGREYYLLAEANPALKPLLYSRPRLVMTAYQFISTLDPAMPRAI